MTVVLENGEALESAHKVNTGFGAGTLHVTNRGLIIETKKQGVIFHRWHNQMASIEARGVRTIRVRWPEGSQMREFEFKAWGHKGIVEQIKQKHDYTANFSAEGVSRVMFNDKQREEIRAERVKWAEQMLKKKESKLEKERKLVKGDLPEVDPELVKDVESWRLVEAEARDAVVNRSVRVPVRVPDHLVWHDAWLDGDYFYTFNKAWLDDSREYIKAQDSEADGKTGAYRIPAEYVRFFHGYPYVRGNAFVTPNRYEVGWFVPTMTEKMLDTDMFVMGNRPRYRHENKIPLKASGTPAILGYTTDHEYSKNAKLKAPMNELLWASKHGYVPAPVLRAAGIPDNYDAEAVGRRVANLKY